MWKLDFLASLFVFDIFIPVYLKLKMSMLGLQLMIVVMIY